jgi:molybdate transport system substrate-binding protein
MSLSIRTFIFLSLWVAMPSYGQSDKLLIAAASDLQFALDSIVKNFRTRQTGKIDLIFGSSGKLFEQISSGAPFDVYFSADMDYPKALEEKGLTASSIYTYGVGRLVLWSKKTDPDQEGIQSLLAPSVRKIAVANPRHAPYGRKAVEALTFYKIHDRIKNKLVYGENVSQTAQFATSGAADMALIALSLAISPNMQRENGQYYLIPEESHQQLAQGAVITRYGRENKLAVVFMDYVKSEAATAVFSHFGFTRNQGK